MPSCRQAIKSWSRTDSVQHRRLREKGLDFGQATQERKGCVIAGLDSEIGLQPGTDVTVLARAPFDGPLTLRIGTSESMVGQRLAEQVLVAADTRAQAAKSRKR